MRKHFLFLMLILASTTLHAEVFRCTTPAGETEFSDTPCKAGSNSEIVPDRDPLTPQEKEAAQQRLRQQTAEANELAAQRTAAQAAPPPPANEPPPSVGSGDDDNVVYGCNDGRRINSNCAPKLDDPKPLRRRPITPRPTPR